MSGAGFTRLDKAMEATLERLGLGVGAANVVVHRVWSEVVGEEVARRSQPGLLRNGRLEVTVTDAVWIQQLTMLKPKILSGLESRVGSGIIRDIFFTLGTPASSAPERQRPTRRRSRRITPQMQEEVESILRPIQDQECREILGRILTQALELG